MGVIVDGGYEGVVLFGEGEGDVGGEVVYVFEDGVEVCWCEFRWWLALAPV